MAVTPNALETDSAAPPPVTGTAQATVARNTLFLVMGQVLGMPLSMAVSAVMARKLGPGDFGYIYLAGTLVGFGFLPVEWGQGATLPQLLAKDRTLLRRAVGSALVWRLASSVLAYGVLALISAILGYGRGFQGVLFLAVIAKIIGTANATFLDAARGLEVTAPTAYSQVRYNLLSAGLVIPTVLLGGRLLSVLVALILADAINMTFSWLGSRKLGMTRLSLDVETLKTMLVTGTSFMLLGLALNLQPNIDAIFLSKLGTPEAMGWYAAARKLVGVLVFPVGALIGALYPTLCRLFSEDRSAYQKMVSVSLRTSTLLVVPMALGAALFPQLGIRIFSETSFGPAEDDLRVMSIFILLLYFTMVLGTAIAAAGRQRAWTMMQFACVVVSAIADPILIPWFHRRAGNGGLGLCVSTVLSEVLMIIGGFLIAPPGLFDRPLLKGIGLSFIAGAAMAVVAYRLTWLSPLVAAPITVVIYGASLWAVGGIDRETSQTLRSMIARKRGRAA